MPYVSPAAIVTGTTISKSTFGDVVKADLDFLANPPSCRVYGVLQSIAHNTEAALAFNSERWDTDAMHDTVTNNSRITIKTAGLYLLAGHVEFPANGTGYRMIGIRWQNTTTLAIQTTKPHGTFADRLTVSCIYKFGVGEWLELRAFQDSGGALNVNSTGNFSPEFSAAWIGLG